MEMITKLTLSILSFIALVLFSITPLQTPAAPSGDGWYGNIALGKQALSHKNAPGLIYVHTTRALPCKKMENETFSDPHVSNRLTQFVRMSVDATQDTSLREQLEIIRVPTIIFLDSQGNEVDRAVGYKTPGDFFQYVDRVLRVHTGEAQEAVFEDSAINILEPREGTTPLRLAIHAPQA